MSHTHIIHTDGEGFRPSAHSHRSMHVGEIPPVGRTTHGRRSQHRVLHMVDHYGVTYTPPIHRSCSSYISDGGPHTATTPGTHSGAPRGVRTGSYTTLGGCLQLSLACLGLLPLGLGLPPLGGGHVASSELCSASLGDVLHMSSRQTWGPGPLRGERGIGQVN